MKQVIATEVAEATLTEWEEIFDVRVDPAMRKKLLRSIEAGELEFDEETAIFTLQLKVPVEQANGKTIDLLTISEPTTEDLLISDKLGPMELAARLLSKLSGQPLGVINKVRARDLTAASAVLSFFG